MTENKRFDAKEYGHVIVYRENGENIWRNKVHIRMNEIWEEKEKLEEENMQLKAYIGEMEDYLARLEEENQQLKQVLGGILIEVRRDISATNHSGEVKAFINPNSFDLISNVLRKYGVDGDMEW